MNGLDRDNNRIDKVNSFWSSGGLNTAEVLTIIFVVLKLTGLIDWSWKWVLSPIWISFGLFFILLAVAVIITILDNAFNG